CIAQVGIEAGRDFGGSAGNSRKQLKTERELRFSFRRLAQQSIRKSQRRAQIRLSLWVVAQCLAHPRRGVVQNIAELNRLVFAAQRAMPVGAGGKERVFGELADALGAQSL